MESDLTSGIIPKHVSIVSSDEDFRLRLALLLSKTYDITFCDDLETMLNGALVLRQEMIVVVDSMLWQGGVLEKMKTYGLETIGHPIHILRFYRYQLEEEMIDDNIVYIVDSVWMRRILSKNQHVQGLMETVYKCLSSDGKTDKS
jgi:hypothetical protein